MPSVSENRARWAKRVRLWRAKYPEKARAISKRYRLKHRTRLLAEARAWSADPANRPKIRKTALAWRKRNVARLMFNDARNRCRRAGKRFRLKLEDIVVPKRCPVLGMKLRFNPGARKDNSPSLDKVHVGRSYVRGNVCVISWRANRLKSNGTAKEFVKIAKYIRRFRK